MKISLVPIDQYFTFTTKIRVIFYWPRNFFLHPIVSTLYVILRIENWAVPIFFSIFIQILRISLRFQLFSSSHTHTLRRNFLSWNYFFCSIVIRVLYVTSSFFRSFGWKFPTKSNRPVSLVWKKKESCAAMKGEGWKHTVLVRMLHFVSCLVPFNNHDNEQKDLNKLRTCLQKS